MNRLHHRVGRVLFGAWLALGMAALCAAPATAARVVDVRVGTHPTFTRVVFELDEAAGYRLKRSGGDRDPQIVVTLDAVADARRLRSGGDIATVRVEGGRTAIAHIRLRRPGLRLQEMILANPPRIVLDVMRDEPAPSPAPKPAAATPTPARQREIAKPAAKPPAPKPVPAKPTPPAPMAEKPAPPPAPVAPEPAPETAAASVPEPEPAPSKPLPDTEPEPALPSPMESASAPPSEPFETSQAPTPPAPEEPEPAVRPAPVPVERPLPQPVRPSRAEPSKPAASPGFARGGPGLVERLVERLPERLTSQPLWVGGVAAGVLVVLILAFVLARRRRSLPSDLEIDEDTEGRIPSGGFAMDQGPDEQEQAPPSSLFDDTSGRRSPPAGALFDDEGEDASQGDAQMSQEIDLPVARSGGAPPPPPVGGVGADITRLVQELERRVATLESKLEEVSEAREKLERQVAAQSEELRVQRAAIARTQRALRTMTHADEEKATEPALRDGDTQAATRMKV